jgi:hypothetical protein
MSVLTQPAAEDVLRLLDHGEIPPLENGDRLTRAEFLRRYAAMPGLTKAELIEGVVYLPSPVRQKYHGAQHSLLVGWMVTYRAATTGTETGDNSTILLDLESAPQPDALLFVIPEHGGRVKFDAVGPEHGEFAARLQAAGHDVS